MDDALICAKCNVALEARKVKLSYLDHQFTHEIPCCPICKQVYIPAELALGRMYEVETSLEDK